MDRQALAAHALRAIKSANEFDPLLRSDVGADFRDNPASPAAKAEYAARLAAKKSAPITLPQVRLDPVTGEYVPVGQAVEKALPKPARTLPSSIARLGRNMNTRGGRAAIGTTAALAGTTAAIPMLNRLVGGTKPTEKPVPMPAPPTPEAVQPPKPGFLHRLRSYGTNQARTTMQASMANVARNAANHVLQRMQSKYRLPELPL
jgi:hypothetical protein